MDYTITIWSQSISRSGDVVGDAAVPGRDAFKPALWRRTGRGRYTNRQTLDAPPKYCSYSPETIWNVGPRIIVGGAEEEESYTADYTAGSGSAAGGADPYGLCRGTGGDGVPLAPWALIWAPKPSIINAGSGGARVAALAGDASTVYAAVNAGLCHSGMDCAIELPTRSFFAPVVLSTRGTARLGTERPFGRLRGYGHLRVESMSVTPGGNVLASGWLMEPNPDGCRKLSPTKAGISATLWTNGRPTLLDSLLPSGTDAHLCDARGVNAWGQVVGVGTIGGVSDSVYLLSPKRVKA